MWNVTVGLIAAVLAAAMVLIGALALGWNNPRPRGAPDWEAAAPLRRLSAAADETALALFDQSGGDGTFELIARPVAGPASGFYGYGLVYRAQDAAHYYAFAVGGDGYYAVVRADGGQEIPLVTWQQFPHVRRQQQPNRLRVTCAGPSCTFTINDEYAATVEDDTWLTGDVGLWARGFDEGVEIEFQSVRLWNAGE